MNRRRRRFCRAITVLLLVLIPSCSGDEAGSSRRAGRADSPGKTTEASPSPSPDATPGRPGALLFLDGRTLVRRDLSSGTDQELAKLPSSDAAASAAGDLVAYVTSAGEPSDHEDFVAQPQLHVITTEGDRDTTIGPGLAPMWHPGGERLAYLEPQEARACEGEVCEGSSSVVVADVAAETRRTILRGGRWSLLGWAGDEVVVGDQDDPSAALSVALDGTVESLALSPAEFWGASPDGRWVLQVDRRGYFLLATGGGGSTPVSLGDGILGAGAWSPTNERIAAVVLDGSRSRLVLIDARGGVETVAGSAGAEGPVLWSPDASSFVYVRGRGLRLEVVHCELGQDCRSLFSWVRGVSLLALAGHR